MIQVNDSVSFSDKLKAFLEEFLHFPIFAKLFENSIIRAYCMLCYFLQKNTGILLIAMFQNVLVGIPFISFQNVSTVVQCFLLHSLYFLVVPVVFIEHCNSIKWHGLLLF